MNPYSPDYSKLSGRGRYNRAISDMRMHLSDRFNLIILCLFYAIEEESSIFLIRNILELLGITGYQAKALYAYAYKKYYPVVIKGESL